MGQLANSVGLAKGTLYLYFKTREEVLLALFEDNFSTWVSRFQDQLNPDLSDEAFCTLFLKTALCQPVFITLLLHLSAVIEHNISVNALISSKRHMRAQMDALSDDIAKALGLTKTQSIDVLMGLAPLLVGTAQHNLAPSMDRTPLPTDVREFITSFETEALFTRNAHRIISGIRAGH